MGISVFMPPSIAGNAFSYGLSLLVLNPTGIVDADYSPATEYGAVLVNVGSNGALSSLTTFDLDATGYAKDSASYASYIVVDQLAVNPGTRKYEIWGRTNDIPLSDNRGVEIGFNRDPILGNYWVAILRWDNASAVFDIQLYRFDAGVGTLVSQTAALVAVNIPAMWHLIVYDHADEVIVQAMLYELDSVGDDQPLSIGYKIVNRAYKNNTKTVFRTMNVAGNDWLIRGCSISEML